MLRRRRRSASWRAETRGVGRPGRGPLGPAVRPDGLGGTAALASVGAGAPAVGAGAPACAADAVPCPAVGVPPLVGAAVPDVVAPFVEVLDPCVALGDRLAPAADLLPGRGGTLPPPELCLVVAMCAFLPSKGARQTRPIVPSPAGSGGAGTPRVSLLEPFQGVLSPF